MTDTCRIRNLLMADLPMALEWRNHPEVRRFMFTRHEITPEEHSRWFAAVSQDASRRLLIVEDQDGALGYVQFSQVAAGGVADWGFYVRPDAPRGSGRRLGAIALKHAFKELRLHKVCGQALHTNLASIRMHLALGFTQEGILRDQKLIEGTYHSLVCFGLLNQDWEIDSQRRETRHESN